MRQRLKTCYKILNLILLVFIDLNFGLLYCFVHFWCSYVETLVQYREIVAMKIFEISPIVKRLMKLIFSWKGSTSLSTLPPGARSGSRRHCALPVSSITSIQCSSLHGKSVKLVRLILIVTFVFFFQPQSHQEIHPLFSTFATSPPLQGDQVLYVEILLI